MIWVLGARWRAASRPQRRVLAPLLWSGMALIALVAVTLTSQTVTGDQVPGILPVAWQLVFAAVPFAFLIGLLRGQLAQADAVGELLQRLGATGTDGLRGLLADALGDPSLQLLYWVEDGWVRRDGRRADRPNHAYTPVELDGELVGAIIHDASLEPEALTHVAAAAGLAMRGERLEAALRRSRARIVEAGLQERRRLERNLHDGAQQRLVALSAHAADRAEPDREGSRSWRPRWSARRRRSSRTRSRSCASSPAASTRRCCPIAGCRPPWRRSRCAPRCRSRSSRSRASDCPSRSRRPPTS